MSGFTAGGFAQGFTSGMGATSQMLQNQKENEMRQKALDLDQARYNDRLAMERERMDRDAQEGALDRALKERELAAREAYMQAQVGHMGSQNKLLDAQASHYGAQDRIAQNEEQRKQAAFNAQEWVTRQQQANMIVKNYSMKAQLASENGMPLPPMSPEEHEAIKTTLGERFVANPREEADKLISTVNGLKRGEIGWDAPEVADAMNVIAPMLTQRGLGERIQNPINDGFNPTVPAGATIVGKEPRGFIEGPEGSLIPILRVHAEHNGQKYTYEGPATVNGTSYMDDQVVTITPEELHKAAKGRIMAGYDETLIRGLKDYGAMNQSPEQQGKALDLEGKRIGLQIKKAEWNEKRLGKDGKRPEIDANKMGQFFQNQFGTEPAADAFLTMRNPQGYESVGGDLTTSAATQASNDAASAHTLNPDVPVDTIASIISTGTWTTAKANGGKIFRGYKARTGEFLPVEPIETPVAQQQQVSQNTKQQSEGVLGALSGVGGAVGRAADNFATSANELDKQWNDPSQKTPEARAARLAPVFDTIGAISEGAKKHREFIKNQKPKDWERR